MIEGLFGIAVLTEDAALMERAAFFWRTRVPSYVYVAADGDRPVPLPVRPGGQGPPNTQGWRVAGGAAGDVKALAARHCARPLRSPLALTFPRSRPSSSADRYGQKTFNASVEGLAQETCRDAEHTQMGLAAALNAAETAHIQGE